MEHTRGQQPGPLNGRPPGKPLSWGGCGDPGPARDTRKRLARRADTAASGECGRAGSPTRAGGAGHHPGARRARVAGWHGLAAE